MKKLAKVFKFGRHIFQKSPTTTTTTFIEQEKQKLARNLLVGKANLGGLKESRFEFFFLLILLVITGDYSRFEHQIFRKI